MRLPVVHIWHEPSFKDEKEAIVKELNLSDRDAKKDWKDLSTTLQKKIEEAYMGTQFTRNKKGKIETKKIPMMVERPR